MSDKSVVLSLRLVFPDARLFVPAAPMKLTASDH